MCLSVCGHYKEQQRVGFSGLLMEACKKYLFNYTAMRKIKGVKVQLNTKYGAFRM